MPYMSKPVHILLWPVCCLKDKYFDWLIVLPVVRGSYRMKPLLLCLFTEQINLGARNDLKYCVFVVLCIICETTWCWCAPESLQTLPSFLVFHMNSLEMILLCIGILLGSYQVPSFSLPARLKSLLPITSLSPTNLLSFPN